MEAEIIRVENTRTIECYVFAVATKKAVLFNHKCLQISHEKLSCTSRDSIVPIVSFCWVSVIVEPFLERWIPRHDEVDWVGHYLFV